MNKDFKTPFEKVLLTEPKNFNSRLINPVTGDLYEWDKFEKKWKAKYNTG